MSLKIFMLNFDAHGHVNPTLAMTRELVARGHDVVYYIPNDFIETVRTTGARPIGYETIFVKSFTSEQKKLSPEDRFARVPRRLVEEAKHVLPQLLSTLKSERPDVFIYDHMCFAGRFAAQVLNIPAIAFRPSYVSNEHFSLRRNHPLFTASHPEINAAQEVLDQLANEYHFSHTGADELFDLAEDLNLIFMPREFHPFGSSFDKKFAFVGPQIAPRSTTATLELPSGDAPLLFISLGTVFNDCLEFFQSTFEAFGGKDCRVLLAIGHRVDPKSLGLVPDNFLVKAHVPQLEVLPHTSLFLTHGGMNSVQESIWNGVPMVVFPQMPEQAQTAQRVAELHMGIAFHERESLSPQKLIEAAYTVYNDETYASQVRAMRTHAQNAGGYMRAADLVEQYQ